MKKSLLRIVALNLAVLMLLSFPFCAFADAEAVVLQGEETFVENNVGDGATIEAVFTAPQEGIYQFYSSVDGLAAWDGETLLGKYDPWAYGEVYTAATAGQTFTIELTDDCADGITVYIYFTPMLPDGEFEGGRYGFVVDETGWYSFFSLSWIVDRAADKTPIGVQNGGVTLYYLTAGTPYEMEVFSNFTYEYQGLEDPFMELVLDGEENPAGFYKFQPETTGFYYYNVPLGIGYWGDMEDYHSTLYAWETYYMYAEEPFTMEALPKPALEEGESYVYPDGLENNVQTFTPEKSGWFCLGAHDGGINWALYDDSELILEAENWDQKFVELTSNTEYTFIFDYDAVNGDEYISIHHYETLTGLPQDVEAGPYTFIPVENGWYSFGDDVSTVYIGDTETNFYEPEIRIFELQADQPYLFYSWEPFDVTKIEFATPAIDGTTENPAGYYTLTGQANTDYYFSDRVKFTEYVSYSESGEEYQYDLNSGISYFFYADAPFTIRAEEFTGALKVGHNKIPVGDYDLTFTPDESTWYEFDYSHYSSYGSLQPYVKVYDGDQLVLDENDYGLLDESKTYTIETNVSWIQIDPYVPITAGTVSENGGYYVFTPTESGKYLFSNSENYFYEAQEKDHLYTTLDEAELEQGKTYLVHLHEGGVITKSTRVYQTPVVDGITENPVGYYEFTPAKSGRYEFSCQINEGTFWPDYDEVGDKYYVIFYVGSTYKFYSDKAFTMEYIPRDSALKEGNNELFIDEISSTEWTFTPDESTWYSLEKYASSGNLDMYELYVYDGDELLGQATEYTEVRVQLTANKTYSLVCNAKMSYRGENGVLIHRYTALSGLPQDVERGDYAYTPAEDGYYSFGGDVYSIWNTLENIGIGGNNLRAYKLQANQTYLLSSYRDFDVTKIEGSTPATDGAQNEAGYYLLTVDEYADYYFSTPVTFDYWVSYDWVGEEVQYWLSKGSSYLFYAEEAFTIRKEGFTGALKEGYNYIHNQEFDLTFTADENSWYKFAVFTSFGNLGLYLYDGEEQVPLNGDGFTTLEGGKTYDVETGHSELYIYKYSPISLGTVSEDGGYYAFSPDESGTYLFTNCSGVYDTQNETRKNKILGEVELEQGITYLFNLDAGGSVAKSTRVYQTLTVNAEQKAAGYYKFVAPQSGRYAFTTRLESSFGFDEFDDENDQFIYTFYSGNEVLFGANESFYVFKLENDTVLETGRNNVYGTGTLELTFTPEINGWHSFWAEKSDTVLKVYQGETLLATGSNRRDLYVQLQQGVTYRVQLQTGQGKDYEWLRIQKYPTLNYVEGQRYSGYYAFTPSVGGEYQMEDLWWIYDIAANTSVDYQGDNVNLIQGRTYLVEFYGHLTYLGDGEHTHIAGDLIVDTPATCGKPGVGHKNCSVCGKLMESNIAISATNAHIAGALITDTAATCGKAGVGHKNCSGCGKLMESNIAIPATGKHTAGALITDTAATCGANGVGHKNCTVCGTVVESNVVIAATGQHTAGNWKSTIQPTYEAKGVDSKFCTVCNKLLETRFVNPLEKAAEVFKDVPEQKWYHEAVSYAYSNNLFKGVTETEFAPTKEMTRAMLVTVLWRYAGEPKGGSSTFSDVPSGKWYSDAVAWAAGEGIVTGVSADRFNPNGIVTRAQMATILYRYSQGVGLDTNKTTDFNAFPDGSSVKNWAKDGMQWAVAEGLITGSKNNGTLYLNPANGATRGQVATILMRYIENIVEA